MSAAVGTRRMVGCRWLGLVGTSSRSLTPCTATATSLHLTSSHAMHYRRMLSSATASSEANDSSATAPPPWSTLSFMEKCRVNIFAPRDVRQQGLNGTSRDGEEGQHAWFLIFGVNVMALMTMKWYARYNANVDATTTTSSPPTYITPDHVHVKADTSATAMTTAASVIEAVAESLVSASPVTKAEEAIVSNFVDVAEAAENVIVEVQPAFSKDDTTVVFVLGGPGVGKGTQCGNLVRQYGFHHLSAGDLLREERQRPGSEFGELIESYIRDGKIVPMEITIALLQNAMTMADGKKRFLIDGFPRQIDQGRHFEKTVCESQFVLHFDAPEQVMIDRIIKRSETSGRVDDNLESIKKRLGVFRDTSFPVIEAFGMEGKVHTIDANRSTGLVFEETKGIFDRLFEGEDASAAL